MWLTELRKEVDTPDLWATVLQDRDFMRLTVIDAGNTPFTPQEQQYISTRLDEMHSFIIASAKLDDAQRRFVDAQIEYTKQATKRLGRIDWKNALIGAFMSIITGLGANAVFAPERARELFHAAAQAFAPLFQSLLSLAP